MPEVFGFRPGSIPDWLDNILVEMPKKQREQGREALKKHYDNAVKKGGVTGYGSAFSIGSAIVTSDVLDAIGFYLDNFSLSPTIAVRGELDNLRVGEGFQRGGWGNVEDSLRLFGLVMPVAGRAFPMVRAMLVGGGPMSCAFTSTLKAIRLGGRRLFAPLSAVAKNFKGLRIIHPEIQDAIGAVIKSDFPQAKGKVLTDSVITGSKFAGSKVTSLKDDILRPLNLFKEHELVSNQIQSLSHAVEVVKKSDGVMLLHFKWKNGGKHVIAVHKTSLGVKFADQNGTFQSLEKLGKNAVESLLEVAGEMKKAGKAFDESYVREAVKNPVKYLESLVTIIESITIKNSVFLPLEHVPVMLQATNPNSFLNHIAIPVFEFSWEFFLSLVQKQIELATQPKKHLPKSQITHLIKKRAGLTERYVQGGNSDTFVMVNEYTVVSGDTLISIARNFYGDAGAISQIQSANPDLMNFVPHAQIPIGKVIIIP